MERVAASTRAAHGRIGADQRDQNEWRALTVARVDVITMRVQCMTALLDGAYHGACRTAIRGAALPSREARPRGA